MSEHGAHCCEDRVLRAAFWTDAKVAKLTAQEKLLFLWLWSVADADGIADLSVSVDVICSHIAIQKTLFAIDTRRLALGRMFKTLYHFGIVAQYAANGKRWAWVPGITSHQPRKGILKPSRHMERPPPPEGIVAQTLANRIGRAPTRPECRAASPRTYGVKRPASAPPSGDVEQVWQCWVKRQKNPEVCVIGGIRPTIEWALRQTSAENICLLFDYAHDGDEAGPRFWRGDNDRDMKYMGIDNLLVKSKFAARLQLAADWKKKRDKPKENTVSEDGGAQLDLGPNVSANERRQVMARWRANLNAGGS